MICPIGLEHLTQARIDVNAEDHDGRRPLNLAIALEAHESINLLLEADCALALYLLGETVLTCSKDLSFRSLLKRTATIEAITKANIDCHKCLRDSARRVLSREQAPRLQIAEGVMCERDTVPIYQEISAYGVTVTPALKLGTENVYEVVDFCDSLKMTPGIASTPWDGGFEDIWNPNEQGLSPMLQNRHCANFEMVQ